MRSIFCFILFFAIQPVLAMEQKTFEFPANPVLSLNKQEEIFASAFEALPLLEIHPLKTIIPGLKPMARMYYSYVAPYIKESPTHLELLHQFWQNRAEIIENDQLTLGRMRVIAMQLASLITNWQGGTLNKDYEDEHYYKIYTADLWKDINNYNEADFYEFIDPGFQPHSFYCEAILCSPQGGFSYERFVNAYLGHSCVIHIAALSLEGKGHGGMFRQSADFLRHDFTHNNIFTTYVTKNQKEFSENSETANLFSYWDTLRSLLKKHLETTTYFD